MPSPPARAGRGADPGAAWAESSKYAKSASGERRPVKSAEKHAAARGKLTWTPTATKSTTTREAAGDEVAHEKGRDDDGNNGNGGGRARAAAKSANLNVEENREGRVLGDNPKPANVVEALDLVLKDGPAPIDFEELVNEYGIERKVLRETLTIMGAFEVVMKDMNGGPIIWNGVSRALKVIEEVLKDTMQSSNQPSSIHLARRLTTVGYHEITSPGTYNPWCAADLTGSYGKLVMPPLTMESLYDIVDLFCKIGFAEVHLKAPTPAKTYYRWSERFVQSVRRLAHRMDAGLRSNIRAWVDLMRASPDAQITSVSSVGTSATTSKFAGPAARSGKSLGGSRPRRRVDQATPLRHPNGASLSVPLAASKTSSSSSSSSQIPGAGVSSPTASKSGSQELYTKYRISNSQGSVVSSSASSSSQRSGVSAQPAKATPSASQRRFKPPRQVSAREKAAPIPHIRYFDHPLPVPNVSRGEPAMAPSLTEKVGRMVPPKSGPQASSLPSPKQMLKYQISCVEEFMAHYCAYYSKATGQPIRTLTTEDMGMSSQGGADVSESYDEDSSQASIAGAQSAAPVPPVGRKDSLSVAGEGVKENQSQNGASPRNTAALPQVPGTTLSKEPSQGLAVFAPTDLGEVPLSQSSFNAALPVSQTFNFSQELFTLSQNSLSSFRLEASASAPDADVGFFNILEEDLSEDERRNANELGVDDDFGTVQGADAAQDVDVAQGVEAAPAPDSLDSAT